MDISDNLEKNTLMAAMIRLRCGRAGVHIARMQKMHLHHESSCKNYSLLVLVPVMPLPAARVARRPSPQRQLSGCVQRLQCTEDRSIAFAMDVIVACKIIKRHVASAWRALD